MLIFFNNIPAEIAEKPERRFENRRFASAGAAEPCIPTEDRGNEWCCFVYVRQPAWLDLLSEFEKKVPLLTKGVGGCESIITVKFEMDFFRGD